MRLLIQNRGWSITCDGCIPNNAQSLFTLQIVFFATSLFKVLTTLSCLPLFNRIFATSGFGPRSQPCPAGGWVIPPEKAKVTREWDETRKWPKNKKTRKLGSYAHLAPTQDTLIHPSSCRWGAGWWIGHSSKKNRNDRTAVHNGYESSSPTKYTVSLVLGKTPGPRVFALFQIIQVIEENCHFHTKERIIACVAWIYNLRIIQ